MFIKIVSIKWKNLITSKYTVNYVLQKETYNEFFSYCLYCPGKIGSQEVIRFVYSWIHDTKKRTNKQITLTKTKNTLNKNKKYTNKNK